MTKHGYEGLLIVIEGTDGSGKSTQLELLKKYIQAQSYGVMVSEWKTSGRTESFRSICVRI